MTTTRVIIEKGRNEASFGIRNMGGPILAQSWLDNGVEGTRVGHFIATPNMVRMEADSEQLVRILYQGTGAPTDRETMIWLNVREIPQKRAAAGDNAIQIAVTQRIKVFYRPPGLAGSALQGARELQWRLADGKVRISNASAFHVTLVGIAAGGELKDTLVIPPMGEIELGLGADALSQLAGAPQPVITYASINDFGGQDAFSTVLDGEKPVKGKPR